MNKLDKDVPYQLSALIASLRRAETQAKTLLQTTRASGLSFGLDYKYLDDAITQLLGRLRYMRLIATRWAAQQEGSGGRHNGHAARVHR
jgi:hypothetical protein